MNAGGYPGDRRRHRRFTRPRLCLSIEGQVYTAHDWSLGGFVVDEYAGALSPGSLFVVEAIGKEPAAMTPVAIRSRVIRTSADRHQLTANFLVIDPPAFALLQALIGERSKPLETPPSP